MSKELFDDVQEVFETQNRPKQTKRHFAYTGLMICGKCGCAITAEVKKVKYVYYHCTGFKGKCGNSYIREEELSDKFAEIIKGIHIDDVVLVLVKTALLDSHKDEVEFHKKQIEVITAQKKRLENRLHQIYIDKIDGKITEAFYDEMTHNWEEELKRVTEAIGRHENADSNYLAQGIHILELCNKAYGLYLRQTPLKRTKLLHYVLSNCTLTDGTPYPTYRKPFDLIAKGLNCTNWLGGIPLTTYLPLNSTLLLCDY